MNNFDILWRFICDIKAESNNTELGFSNLSAKNFTNEQKRAIVNIILQFSCESDIIKAIKKNNYKDLRPKEIELDDKKSDDPKKYKIFHIEKKRKFQNFNEKDTTGIMKNESLKYNWNEEEVVELKPSRKNSQNKKQTQQLTLSKKRKNCSQDIPSNIPIIADGKFYTNIYDELKSLYFNKQRGENKIRTQQELNNFKRNTEPIKLQSFPKFLKDENIFQNVNFLSSNKSKCFSLILRT